MQVVSSFFLLVTFGCYPLITLFRHLLHRNQPAPELRSRMRWLAACGFASVAGGFLYLMFPGLTNANVVGPVLLGNPLPWLALHGTSFVTIALAVWIAVTWYRQPGSVTGGRVHLALLLAATTVFAVWSTY